MKCQPLTDKYATDDEGSKIVRHTESKSEMVVAMCWGKGELGRYESIGMFQLNKMNISSRDLLNNIVPPVDSNAVYLLQFC